MALQLYLTFYYNPVTSVLLSPFYSWGLAGFQKCPDLPEITQLPTVSHCAPTRAPGEVP